MIPFPILSKPWKSLPENQVVLVDEEFLWRNWKTLLAEDFVPLLGIRKYQYFRFSGRNPRVVHVKETSADVELPITLSRSSTADTCISCKRLPLGVVRGYNLLYLY